eukprot:7726613-Ditylum_brightwellii.AAC.1
MSCAAPPLPLHSQTGRLTPLLLLMPSRYALFATTPGAVRSCDEAECCRGGITVHPQYHVTWAVSDNCIQMGCAII